jgi:hypothetical protein
MSHTRIVQERQRNSRTPVKPTTGATKDSEASPKTSHKPVSFSALPPLTLPPQAGSTEPSPSPSSSVPSTSRSSSDEEDLRSRFSPVTLNTVAIDTNDNEAASRTPSPTDHANDVIPATTAAAASTTQTSPATTSSAAMASIEEESSIIAIVEKLNILDAITGIDASELKQKLITMDEKILKVLIKNAEVKLEKINLNKITAGLNELNKLIELSDKITTQQKADLKQNEMRLHFFCTCLFQVLGKTARSKDDKSNSLHIPSVLKKAMTFLKSGFNLQKKDLFLEETQKHVSIIGMEESTFLNQFFGYQATHFLNSLILLNDLLKSAHELASKNNANESDINNILKTLSLIPFRKNIDKELEFDCPEFISFTLKQLPHIPATMFVTGTNSQRKELQQELASIIKTFIVQVLKSLLRNPIFSEEINGYGFEFLYGFFSDADNKTCEAKAHEGTLLHFVRSSIEKELDFLKSIVKKCDIKKSKANKDEATSKKPADPKKPASSTVKDKKQTTASVHLDATKKIAPKKLADKTTENFNERIQRHVANKHKFASVMKGIPQNVLQNLYTYNFKEELKDENKPNNAYFSKNFSSLIKLHREFIQSNITNVFKEFKEDFENTNDYFLFVALASDFTNVLIDTVDEQTKNQLKKSISRWDDIIHFRHMITHIADNLDQITAIILDYKDNKVKPVESELKKFFIHVVDTLITLDLNNKLGYTAPADTTSTMVVTTAAKAPLPSVAEDHKTLEKAKKERTSRDSIAPRIKIAQALVCVLKKITYFPSDIKHVEIKKIDVLIRAIGEALGCLNTVESLKIMKDEKSDRHKTRFSIKENKEKFTVFIQQIQRLRDYRNFRTHSGHKLNLMELHDHFAALRKEAFSEQLSVCLQMFIDLEKPLPADAPKSYHAIGLFGDKGLTKLPMLQPGNGQPTDLIKESMDPKNMCTIS